MTIKTLIFRVDKSWLWVIFLTFGIAFTTSDYAHPLGRMGFSILWLVLAYGHNRIWAEYKIDKGPRWLWIPLSLIGLSALLHATIRHSLTDLMGLLLVVMCYGAYLLARSFRDKLPYVFAVLPAVASLSIIIGRSINPEAVSGFYKPGMLGMYHIACFVILCGLLLAPKKSRIILLVVGLPAIIMSSSEEAIACLVVLGLLMILKGDWSKKILVGAGLVGVAIIVLFASGWFSLVYPNLHIDRFTTGAETLSNSRWDAYVAWWYEAPKLTGGGWEWNSTGSTESLLTDWPLLWRTIHNAPLRVAGHYGLLAGIAWLFVFAYAFWYYRKTEYAYVFALILVISMLDHMLWTHLIIWPWVILGIVQSQEALESQVHSR